MANKRLLTEVTEMHNCVDPSLNEDYVADDLVQVDVVVEWQDGSDAEFPHDRDGVSQDQHQNQHGVV